MGSRCSLPAFSFYFIHKIQVLLPYSQSDEKTESEDIISAWKKLNEIPLSNLTPGIKKKYLERRLFVLLLLGDLEKRKDIFHS